MGQAQSYEPLTDDELLAAADDPELSKLLNSADRRRLQRVRPPKMEASVNIGDRTFAANAFDNPDAVTLGQFVDDPVGSMQRIGQILKKDLTDPKLWGQAALAYFGPKAVGIVGRVASSPAIRAGLSAARPALAKAALGYRGGQVVEAAEAAMGAAKAAKGTPSSPAAPSAPPETVPGGKAPQADLPPEPAPGAQRAKSPRQTLNEEAIARRRSEYQAKQQVKSPAISPEIEQEYLRLRQMGKTDEQAKEAILASLQMNAEQGLKIPTAAETKFPKGNRGGPPKKKP